MTLAITAPSSTFLCYLLVVNRGFPLPDCPVRFSLQTYWHFAWGAGEGGRIELQELSLSGHPSNNFYHVVVAKQQRIRERFFCTQKTERVALVSFSPFFRSKKKWREIERSSCRLCRNHSGQSIHQPELKKPLAGYNKTTLQTDGRVPEIGEGLHNPSVKPKRHQ